MWHRTVRYIGINFLEEPVTSIFHTEEAGFSEILPPIYQTTLCHTSQDHTHLRWRHLHYLHFPLHHSWRSASFFYHPQYFHRLPSNSQRYRKHESLFLLLNKHCDITRALLSDLYQAHFFCCGNLISLWHVKGYIWESLYTQSLTGSSGEFLWSSSELELCSERCLCPLRNVVIADEGGVGLGAALSFFKLWLFSKPVRHAGGAAKGNGSMKHFKMMA